MTFSITEVDDLSWKFSILCYIHCGLTLLTSLFSIFQPDRVLTAMKFDEKYNNDNNFLHLQILIGFLQLQISVFIFVQSKETNPRKIWLLSICQCVFYFFSSCYGWYYYQLFYKGASFRSNLLSWVTFTVAYGYFAKITANVKNIDDELATVSNIQTIEDIQDKNLVKPSNIDEISSLDDTVVTQPRLSQRLHQTQKHGIDKQ